MINPVAILLEIGCVVGVALVIIVGAVAVAFESKGKRQKYKYPTDKYDDGCWERPRCGGTVGIYEIRDNYCSECGTKIDWSEKTWEDVFTTSTIWKEIRS